MKAAFMKGKKETVELVLLVLLLIFLAVFVCCGFGQGIFVT